MQVKIWTDSELNDIHNQFNAMFTPKAKPSVNWEALKLQTQAKLNREKALWVERETSN